MLQCLSDNPEERPTAQQVCPLGSQHWGSSSPAWLRLGQQPTRLLSTLPSPSRRMAASDVCALA